MGDAEGEGVDVRDRTRVAAREYARGAFVERARGGAGGGVALAGGGERVGDGTHDHGATLGDGIGGGLGRVS